MKMLEPFIPAKNRDACAAIAAWILKEDDFLLITHVSPDGDAIGSSLALYGILKSFGKRAVVCCEQPVPNVYGFLPFADQMRLASEIETVPKNTIALDCADAARMGIAQTLFAAGNAKCVIDHHLTGTAYADYFLHDAQAAATAELVMQLWAQLQPDFSKSQYKKEIATCLFVGLSTDTGHFAYRNTTPHAFETAAQLVALGVDVEMVSRLLYRTVSIVKTRLRGHVLSTLQLFENGRIGMATITQQDLRAYGAVSEDVEGMIDGVRDIESVEIAVLIREASDGSYKVSFRSKAQIDASKLAASFGGGGHFGAAACTIADTLENATTRVYKAVVEALPK